MDETKLDETLERALAILDDWMSDEEEKDTRLGTAVFLLMNYTLKLEKRLEALEPKKPPQPVGEKVKE